MIVIPREAPVVSNLHTNYIKIRRFIEHFRPSMPAGCVYLRAPEIEGAVFFNGGKIVNAHLCRNGEALNRQSALEAFLVEADGGGQSVSVFEIPEETIHYWANLGEATSVHKNLTSSTVNMDALMKKIIQEQFTGLIEVLNAQGRADQIHVIQGEISGAVLGKSRGILRDPDQELAQIMANAKHARTRIGIKRVALDPLVLDDTLLDMGDDHAAAPTASPEPLDPIEMLESLLGIVEATYQRQRDIKDPFDTALKRKFLEKVSVYEFLDPFTEEFLYQEGAITYSGSDPVSSVVGAVTECLRELSHERGLGVDLQQALKGWRQRYQQEIDTFAAII